MKRTCLVLALLALTVFSHAADPAPAPVNVDKNTWPVFRGDPLQTGVAETTLPAKLEVLWSLKTGDSIEGAPVVADGIVYVGSMNETFYALDLATGKEKWTYKAGPFKASAALHGDRVYVGDMNGIFHCIDTKTGKKIWTFETGAEITSGANFAGDAVLFGSYDETLYCLEKDGKVRWKLRTEGPVNGSPAVVGGRTFVAGCDSVVHIIDVAQGKELATVELSGQAAATAAVAGDELYVGTMTNQVHAVSWKKAAITWTFQADRRAQPFYSSAAVTDSLVVVGSRDRKVWAIDRKTGKAKWSYVTDGRVDASPVIVGERIYAGSLDGKLYVLELATGREIQRLELDNSGVTGSPCAASNRLLVGTADGVLYCLGGKK